MSKTVSSHFVDKSQSKFENSTKLKVQRHNSIYELDRDSWNTLFDRRGSFTWEGLASLEATFNGQDKKESNWNFYYILIRDEYDKVVLATFLTESWWKDDMMADESVSSLIEGIRKKDPYYLASKVLMLGSLITEGQHLYIDREHPMWKKSLMLLLDEAWAIQKSQEIKNLVLRDFDPEDKVLEDFFLSQGLLKVASPDAHVIDELDWNTQEEYLDRLSKKARRHVRKQAIDKASLFDVDVMDSSSTLDTKRAEEFFKLYQSVASQNFEINTFLLPKNIFSKLLAHPQWELLVLRLSGEDKVVSVLAAFKTQSCYCPIFLGLDYQYVASHGSYRQMLWQIILRAKALQKQRIHFGFSASLEKRRFSAKAMPVCAYVQIDDTYKSDVINNIAVTSDDKVEKTWRTTVSE